MGNAAFSEATGVVSHQASGFSVDPSFFVEHPHAPFPIEAHPKIMHIPFDHVRVAENISRKLLLRVRRIMV